MEQAVGVKATDEVDIHLFALLHPGGLEFYLVGGKLVQCLRLYRVGTRCYRYKQGTQSEYIFHEQEFIFYKDTSISFTLQRNDIKLHS